MRCVDIKLEFKLENYIVGWKIQNFDVFKKFCQNSCFKCFRIIYNSWNILFCSVGITNFYWTLIRSSSFALLNGNDNSIIGKLTLNYRSNLRYHKKKKNHNIFAFFGSFTIFLTIFLNIATNSLKPLYFSWKLQQTRVFLQVIYIQLEMSNSSNSKILWYFFFLW